jgi:hypothetical protein
MVRTPALKASLTAAILVAVVCLLSATSASAAALTAAQKATFKTNVLADPSLAAAVAAQDWDAVAAAYNAAASPAFWVWKTAVSKDEYLGSTSIDGTTFSFVGTGYITRAQGERDAWNALFDANGFANPSRVNVRQAVADIFSGATAPAPANRTHLLTVSRRTATRLEKLFATGTGSTAVPATLVVEGTVTSQVVSDAMGGL